MNKEQIKEIQSSIVEEIKLVNTLNELNEIKNKYLSKKGIITELSSNMKNIPKYIDETRKYFISKYGLCAYARDNYSELSNGVTILKAKIVSLTEATETILEKQQHLLDEKDAIIAKQAEEIEALKKQLAS